MEGIIYLRGTELFDHTESTILDEHGRYYGLPCGRTEMWPQNGVNVGEDIILDGGWCHAGAIHPSTPGAGDPDVRTDPPTVGWLSCNENLILLWKSEDTTGVYLRGRRHGCAELMRFLPPYWEERVVSWRILESQAPDVPPWTPVEDWRRERRRIEDRLRKDPQFLTRVWSFLQSTK